MRAGPVTEPAQTFSSPVLQISLLGGSSLKGCLYASQGVLPCWGSDGRGGSGTGCETYEPPGPHWAPGCRPLGAVGQGLPVIWPCCVSRAL